MTHLFHFGGSAGLAKYRGGNSWRDGTGRYFSRQNFWRDGTVFFFFLAGRDGFFFSEAGRGGCFFFPRRDEAVVFFPEAGRGGCIFFPRRDGAVVFFWESGRDGVVVFFQRRDLAVVFFVRVGTGVFFSAGTGRLTVVVFSAGTVLPTGNDEDGTRELQILAPCL